MSSFDDAAKEYIGFVERAAGKTFDEKQAQSVRDIFVQGAFWGIQKVALARDDEQALLDLSQEMLNEIKDSERRTKTLREAQVEAAAATKQ
jgi:hypothetical protein